MKFWPKVNGAINRTLNGNHEMYTGGRAYYSAIQKFGQTSSYFALQNDHWILVGLDTSYNDHDLHGDQAAWVKGLADASPNKKLVLFSHHQPFSLLDSQGPKLVEKLEALFTSKRIYAWYWGHEHHCILYGPHKLYGLRGHCVGHGGFPYDRETKVVDPAPPPRPVWRRLDSRNLVPSGRMLDGINPFIEKHKTEYRPARIHVPRVRRRRVVRDRPRRDRRAALGAAHREGRGRLAIGAANPVYVFAHVGGRASVPVKFDTELRPGPVRWHPPSPLRCSTKQLDMGVKT